MLEERKLLEAASVEQGRPEAHKDVGKHQLGVDMDYMRVGEGEEAVVRLEQEAGNAAEAAAAAVAVAAAAATVDHHSHNSRTVQTAQESDAVQRLAQAAERAIEDYTQTQKPAVLVLVLQLPLPNTQNNPAESAEEAEGQREEEAAVVCMVVQRTGFCSLY